VTDQPIRSEPPGKGRPNRRLLWYVLEPLIAHPGEWFLIGSYSSYKTAQSLSSELRNRRRKIPPGRWEFTFGEMPKPTTGKPVGVWARYLGPEPTETNLEEWSK
jgi:hypothetical protein